MLIAANIIIVYLLNFDDQFNDVPNLNALPTAIERKKIMIEIKHVTKVYGGTHKAVDNISLTIPTGEIIGFIGPNGAGKTTTIKMITGVLNPDEGEILINGKNIVTHNL